MAVRKSLRIKGKVALTLAALLLSFAVAVVGFAHVWLKKEVEIEMEANARGAMRVLAVAFGNVHRSARIAVDRDAVTDAVVTAMPTFPDHDIVDQTAEMISGVATVFELRGSQGQVRVSTTVKTENGSRAIGTALAADHPARVRLDRGEFYYGPASLFGQAFITGYHPVKNAAGHTVGALFVGLPMQRSDAMVAGLTKSIATVAAGVLIVLAAVSVFLVVRLARPVVRADRRHEGTRRRQFRRRAAGLERRDEVGEMAQAVETFKVKAAEKARREAEEKAADESRARGREAAPAEEREAAQQRAAEDEGGGRAQGGDARARRRVREGGRRTSSRPCRRPRPSWKRRPTR